MLETPEIRMVLMLRELQGDLQEMRAEMEKRLSDVTERLDRADRQLESLSRMAAYAGEGTPGNGPD